MSAAKTPLVLYGLDGSQPCRTVSWLLRIKNVDFEYVTVMPGKQTKAKDFLAKNPWATVPVIEHEGFFLSESASIITYLAEYYGWTDLYPKQDLEVRSKIDAWLHWHHRNSREFTLALFAPLLRPDLKLSAERIAEGKRQLDSVCKSLNNELKTHQFLIGDQPTLADFCVFGDVGQCHVSEMGLFDFAPYQHVERWIQRMRALPHYAETHVMLTTFKQIADKAKAKQQQQAKL